MKKLLLLLLCLLPLAGCTAQAQAQVRPEAEDPYTLEEGQTEVYGKVRTAFGNEITVVLGARSGGAQAGDGAMPAPGAEDGGMPDFDPANGEMPDFGAGDAAPSGERGERSGGPDSADGMQNMAAGGAMPDMAGGGRGSVEMPAGGGGQSRGGMPGSGAIELTYGDEEAVYLIPVTATVQSGSGENAATIRFTQIAEKNVVRIVLDENGTVVLVQVLQ